MSGRPRALPVARGGGMSDFIVAWYPWIKALHLIAVIAWMAGMLYLPRLFVYHASVKPGSEMSETFKMMERRLLRAIIDPAMGATWLLGLTLAWVQDWTQGWLIAKFILVLAMSALHGVYVRWFKDFAADRNTRPPRIYRIANEIPTVLLIAIVILVIVKPF
jgi:putative membrane protein